MIADGPHFGESAGARASGGAHAVSHGEAASAWRQAGAGDHCAFFFAQRARWASAIFARLSADTTRFFLRVFGSAETGVAETAAGAELFSKIAANSVSSF